MKTTVDALDGFAVLAAAIVALTLSVNAVADEVASFATGGYAAGLRTKEMMHKIDSDGDGTISRAEWDAFQERVFSSLDTHKRGKLSTRIFASRTELRIGSFATGGYANGLRSAELAHKIDADGDGWITHEEWMTYNDKLFDLMNTDPTHKHVLTAAEMVATGGGNR